MGEQGRKFFLDISRDKPSRNPISPRETTFTAFKESRFLFPGNVFLDVPISRGGRRQHADPNLWDPIAVRVFDVCSSVAMNNLRVRAIFPSGSVRYALSGQSLLLLLFNSFVSNRPATESSSGNDRQTLTKLFWYLTREVLAFMASVVTSDARYPTTVSVMSCCAIPASQNCKNHDRKRGPDSSFDEGGLLGER